MTLGPVLILCLILVAVAVLIPGKKKPVAVGEQRVASLFEAAPVRFSIREQQAEEAAAAIAAEFRRKDHEAWLNEQIDRASQYFGGPPAKA